MFKLIVRLEPFGQRVIPLREQVLRIGRGNDQDICIPDRKISGAHAVLQADGGGFVLHDLGSTNGTYVNGVLLTGARRLEADDEVLFGNTRVLYTDREPEQVVWPEPAAAAPGPESTIDEPGPRTVKFNVRELERDFAHELERGATAERLQRKLQVLFRMTSAARALRSSQAILEEAVALVLEVTDADRGAAWLVEGDQLEEVVVRTLRSGVPERGSSRAILAQVLATGEAILSRDAREDQRFQAHQSIHTFNIRSALAVPLRAQDEVFGVLHLDKREARQPFDEEDLQLVVIVAQQVGAAIANLRLIEAITRTNRELEAARDEILRWNRDLEDKVEVRTREVQAQAGRIAELVQQKDALLGMVAHDLRTPLTGILGFCEIAQAGLDAGLDPERVREDLEVIRTTAVEMNDLLTDLLDVSKIEAGRVQIEPRTVDLARLIEDGRRRYELWAGAKRIVVRFALPPDLPPVRLDPRRIQQVLNNLISNAIKFSSPGGTITVSARPGPERVEVAVTDTGQGIDPADQDRIFARFEQASSRATAGEGGTGLGLAIAKKLIELHGGTIWVESRRGVGSKFTFSLPA